MLKIFKTSTIEKKIKKVKIYQITDTVKNANKDKDITKDCDPKIIDEKNHEYTIYEKIINLCDLMCTDIIMTVDKRLIDLIIRKGAHENTQYHIKETYKLKEYFDNLLGFNLYDLFPEIKENL